MFFWVLLKFLIFEISKGFLLSLESRYFAYFKSFIYLNYLINLVYLAYFAYFAYLIYFASLAYFAYFPYLSSLDNLDALLSLLELSNFLTSFDNLFFLLLTASDDSVACSEIQGCTRICMSRRLPQRL